MTLTLVLTVGLGALAAGYVTGLAGFGTGLIALGFWLHVIDPLLAAPLVVICSLIAQTQSLFTVRHAVNIPRLWPFILGGLPGVPFGALVLDYMEAGTFRAILGVFLVLYTSFMLWNRSFPMIAWGGRTADAVVGFGGGVLGGTAGLSGPLPTIWCGLRGWAKDEQRAVFQPFNLAILLWALVAYWALGVLTEEVGWLTLVCLPGTLLGARLGVRSYGRVNDRQFRIIVLWLLFASGAALTLSNAF
ncbi:MAG: sulfite exporter TauE/SafE family protein [Rhodospirillales bacterium]|nr:sulfite exporter TauE/SafE family protein [Rhodospirillales bacterium]MDH3918670.1 sulfite exporter TauE/SafE family protein [Rhodospirillales bacterium]MDH3968913.1 sulfite exporter TauE/SafE family protein [Rhodospirillales bacterium]